VPQGATDLIELGVGVVCVLAAIAAWRRGLRPAGIVLAAAGLAAVVHALWHAL